jgi:subtilisin family serine protease
MKMSTAVVRRFDLRVDEAKELGGVRDWLVSVAKETESSESLTCWVKAVERLNLLEVRLEGNSVAISRVVAHIADRPTLRIHRDSVRQGSPAEPELHYPDPRALVRIGLEPGSPVPPVRSTAQPVTGTETVTVAVIDSGIMVTHPDLERHLWRGTVDGLPHRYGARCIGGALTPDIADQDGHGTRLAGTVLSVTGGRPDIRLMAVKFFDPDALPGPVNGAAAIEFATGAQPKADIINLSWDLGIGSIALAKAIEKACEAGALVVIAAGNSGTDNDRAPAIPAYYRTICPEQIITVMATDRYNEKASFSNYGAETVDLAAPGVDIVTTRASLSNASKNDLRQNPFYRRYASYNGTSAAAALVSGAAALLKSLNPTLTAYDLKMKLCKSVRKMPGLKSKCVTGGLLNLP